MNQEHADIFELLKTNVNKTSPTRNNLKPLIRDFEVQLLTILGFWHQEDAKADKNTQTLIEELLERRLKSKYLFSKLN